MENLMTAQDVRTTLQIKETCFWQLRRNGKFPPPVINLSKKFQRWDPKDVEAFKKGEWPKVDKQQAIA